MRLLLDENLPTRLRHDFLPHEVFTVRYKGWKGKRNGELLALMLSEGFEALITADEGLQYQQNFATYPITVFVLRAHRINYESLTVLSPLIMAYLTAGNMPPGPVIIQAALPSKT